MKITDIHNYLSETKEHFERQCNADNIDDNVKKQFTAQIDAIENLKNWLSWQEKNSIEKQSARISSLATMKKVDALKEIIIKQEWAIESYELFTTTLPYIKVINDGRNNVLKPLLDFCNLYIEKIDASSTYRKEYPTEIEIEKAFDCYYKSISDKSNSFKECFIRIEILHKELLSRPTL